MLHLTHKNLSPGFNRITLWPFFDNADPNGEMWETKYANKKIRLTKNGKSFEATIVDTCGNPDCNGCCSENAQGGFLVDIEY